MQHYDDSQRRQRRRALCVRLAASGVLSMALSLSPSAAEAGGGPENVVLVVNPRSWASLTIANYYCQLRGIPPSNVIALNWSGYATTDVNTFRNRILQPVIDEIQKRGLGNQTDYIIYSADLPYRVSVHADVGSFSLHKAVGRNASINGLTYLHQLVRAKRPEYMALRTNFYCRPPILSGQDSPSQGFRSWYGWDNNGALVEAGGLHYMLSAMLGVTHGRGNSVQEIVRYLSSAQKADGARPGGTIYYVNNSDIRTKARRYAPGVVQGQDEYAAAIEALGKLGVRAKLVSGAIPQRAPDIMGLMTGVPFFDWGASGNRIMSGAICENFTSYGAIFTDVIGKQGVGSQTPLSVLLRHGAAGSSGTVAEPMSHQQKFPLAAMHVHYARGCSLAEAFYQSVQAPWQLLVVGDPLCRPWARIPEVSVAGVSANEEVAGVLTLRPTSSNTGGRAPGHFQLFVDGLRRHACGVGESLKLDTTKIADGYHELRFVAIESGAIETQGRLVVPIQVSNQGRKILADTRPQQKVALGDKLQIGAQAAGAGAIAFFHQGRELGRIEKDAAVLTINSAALGLGQCELQAIAYESDGQTMYARAAPVAIQVLPPKGMAPVGLPSGARLQNGLELSFAGKTLPLVDTTQPNWFEKTGIAKNQRFQVDGYFGAATNDIYQFRVGHAGNLELKIDGKVVHSSQHTGFQNHYVPLSLVEGTHSLAASGETGSGPPRFELSFGGPVDGVRAVDGARFQHVAP